MVRNKKLQEELWITNISRTQDVSIGDLLLTVPRGISLNLLSKKKNGLSSFNLTRKQIMESISSGSIYKKGKYIKVRQVIPEVILPSRVEVASILDMSSTRSVRKPTKIEKIEFPDLDNDIINKFEAEEVFAAEISDMDAADRAPILAVDPIFKRITNE